MKHLNQKWRIRIIYVYLLLDDDEEFSRRTIRLCETEEQAKRLVEEGLCIGYNKIKLINDEDIEIMIWEWKQCH